MVHISKTGRNKENHDQLSMPVRNPEDGFQQFSPDFMLTPTILREPSSLKKAHQTFQKACFIAGTLMQMFENISQE